jgi:hypothetical protein
LAIRRKFLGMEVIFQGRLPERDVSVTGFQKASMARSSLARPLPRHRVQESKVKVPLGLSVLGPTVLE